MIGLVTTAWRRRSWACSLIAAVVAVAFSGFVPLPWPGHPPRPALLLAGDLYVLCGLAVLTGTALVLARESLARESLARESLARDSQVPAGPGRVRPVWPSWPSLIGWTGMAWSPEVRLPSPTPSHRPKRNQP
jgi:hypothetical protein